MPIYGKGERDVVDLVREVMFAYHAELGSAEVKVDVMSAAPKRDESGIEIEDALKLNGYPCLATIKILGPKDRGVGRGDALLTYDAFRWEELSDAQRRALIDHELTHLELCVDDGGRIKRDDYDRPKMKMRLHDHQFGWFDDVAQRHAEASLEVSQARQFADNYGQYYFDFASR